jgi:hypothetical protein
MEYVGLYLNVRAGLNVNVILMPVWISSNSHDKTSNGSMQRPSPVF